MIDFRLLQHVVAVAEHGSYRKAAAAVHLSQPALTRSVQQAERHYGVPLFDRRSRPICPTPFGRIVIDKAREIFSQVDSIAADLGLLSGCHAGKLAVGAGPMISEVLLPQAIEQLIVKHPGISLHVRVDNWLELNQALHRDAIEFYIAAVEQSDLEANVQVINLPPRRAFWFCRTAHPLAQRRRISAADLIAYPIVVPTVPLWSRQWLEDAQREAGRPAVVHTISENFALIKKLVNESNCITAATRSVVGDELSRRAITELRVAGPAMSIQAGIIHRRDRTLSPAARELMDMVLGVARAGGSASQISRPHD